EAAQVSASFDLDPVARITAGAIGEPGRRTFYLQGRSSDQLVTLLVEKEQVRALAVSIEQMLAVLPDPSEPPEETDEPDLEEPLLPEWRGGPMPLQYDEENYRRLI